jgi:hypothetical protein
MFSAGPSGGTRRYRRRRTTEVLRCSVRRHRISLGSNRCPFWTGITPPSTKAGILRRACRCLSDSSHISTRERIRKRPTPHSSPTATRYFSIGLPLSTGCSAVCNLLPRDRRTTIRTLAINRFPAASISSMTTSTRGACPPGWSHCPRDPRQGRAPVDVAGRLPVGRTGD